MRGYSELQGKKGQGDKDWKNEKMNIGGFNADCLDTDWVENIEEGAGAETVQAGTADQDGSAGSGQVEE